MAAMQQVVAVALRAAVAVVPHFLMQQGIMEVTEVEAQGDQEGLARVMEVMAEIIMVQVVLAMPLVVGVVEKEKVQLHLVLVQAVR